jgi:O-antigen/teichoic acid export membrane protein
MNQESPHSSSAVKSRQPDVHGQRQLARNILTNWGAQVFHMIAGFVVPRLIDRQLSQEALGVWDLAWSIVVYFNLVQIGVTSSINRYVAFHRAKDDFSGVNRVVSSVALIMRGMGVLVVLLSVAAWFAVGNIFQHRLGVYVSDARWLVFLLGINIAVQISATIYSSVLTGCHRWDWHNGIQSCTHLLSLIGMVTVLLCGQGLVALALVTVGAEFAGRMARIIMVRRLWPWLQIRRAHFDPKTAREMFSFGGKTFATQVSQLVMNSTVGIMIASFLGPAALAVYTRPISLMRNLGVFINKYAMVFSPTISSLQGAGQHERVRGLAFKATRYGLYLSLPIIIFIIVFGAEVLRLWMGSSYAHPWLIALIGFGFFWQVSHIPLFKALVGLNFHGQPGLVNLISAGLTITAAYGALLFFEGGVVAVAACVATAMTIVHGIYIPVYACKKLGLSAGEFWREVWRSPLYCAFPYTVCLLLARWYFRESLTLAACIGAVIGACVLAIGYWRSALPDRWKLRLLKLIRLDQACCRPT